MYRVIAITGAAIAFLVAFVFVNLADATAFGARSENQIVTTYRNNQNVLSSYTVRIKEMAKIPDMMTNDLKEVISAEMAGRYGPSGSQATMQWIRENASGKLSPELYTRIQAAIESGRVEFRDEQSKLLDQKRVYQTNLQYVWKGFWLGMAGYPKINLDDYDVIVSTAAQSQFENGVEEELDLNTK